LLIPGLSAVIFGVVAIGGDGGFFSPQVLVPIALGALALTQFVRHSLRAAYALVDLRLFKDRLFAACTGTLFVGIVAVFGGLLLLPLYLQTVRGETAMDTGLLLAPQGLGAVVAMPLAGWLADRTPIGRIVPVGLALIVASFLMLTQITPDTTYLYFAAAVFVMGAGMGATMIPMFSGAMRTLTKPQVARASTSINIIQQAGAAIGTALLTVILARQLAGGPLGDLELSSSLKALGPAEAAIAANAYGATFAWAAALTGIAFVIALVFLPQRMDQEVPREPEAATAGATL
jgi:predicted MFS family arabinose efflux permease